MNKTFTEFLYGKDFKKALDCFENKLNELETKHSEYLKDNNIEFKESYIMTFNSRTFDYLITDEEVRGLMSSDFDKAFENCFSDVLTIVSKT